MSPARALPAVVLVLAFAAAACSSSGGSANNQNSGGSTRSTDAAGDLAVAKQAVLRSGDLHGYKAAPHTSAADIPAPLRRKFAQCMGTPTTIFDTVPGAQSADSPDFAKGSQNELQVTSSVEIDPSSADVDARWKQFVSKETGPCLRQLFQELLTHSAVQQFHLGPVQVTPFEVGVGNRSLGYGMSRSAMGPRQIIELDIDVVYAVRDRAGMQFHFFNFGPTPDRALEKQLVQKVYDRVGGKAA